MCVGTPLNRKATPRVLGVRERCTTWARILSTGEGGRGRPFACPQCFNTLKCRDAARVELVYANKKRLTKLFPYAIIYIVKELII